VSIGKVIVEKRRSLNMSQGQFAEKIGVARQTVSSWENDVFTPDTQKVIQMAKLFDCTTDELLNPAQAE